ncbi:MAG TPA: hypothetical protein PLP48_00340 [Acholeplasmataceae bacterium]|nr:hypothetical protein [Acholeplasmataceae bacterium]
MNEQSIKQENKKEKAVQTQSIGYVKMDDLLNNYTDQVKLLPKYNVKLRRLFSAKGREQVSILVEIHPEFYKALVLKDGTDYLSPERFNALALAIDLQYKDAKGRDLTEWNYKVPVRFITGSFANSEGNYKAIQVIFSKTDFFTHIFQRDEIRLIDRLEEKKLIKIDWIQSPEKINNVDLVDIS